MSTRAFKLLTLLSENLLEVGDLANIQPYDKVETLSNGQYQFFSENGSTVDVMFVKMPSEYGQLIKSPQIINKKKITEYFNLGYSVDNQDTQAKKSNIRELLKIMKTISKITEEWLAKHKNCAILILETSKTNKITPGQKTLLYQAVISKNLPSNYTSVNIKFAGTQSLLIAPKL